MRRLSLMLALLFHLLLTAGLWAATAEEFEISVDRLSDRVALVSVGEVYSDAILVVSGRDGLLVVDTGIAPSLTARYRAVIEETFERGDFAYVVNTHYHFDHSDGNQVFADATIVGHDRCREGMLRFGERKDEFVARQRARVEAWKRQREGVDPSSEPARRRRDNIASYGLMCDDLESGFQLTPPSVTFSDRMTIHLGDVTANLYHWGQGTHTGDDVVVHVPEEGLVATGDLFYPGGIQFANSPGVDVPRQLEVLDAILSGDVRHVVTVHNGIMTRSDLEIRRDYTAELSRQLAAAWAQDEPFAEIRRRLTVDRAFAGLKSLDIEDAELERQHQSNMTTLWIELTGAERASEVIDQALQRGNLEAATARYREMLAERDERYFFDENAFNALGYRLMGAGQIEEAIAVFRMNVELFPESWNVYDSLGEAYMERGDRRLAISNYERSLALNPDNANGVSMLERLRAQE